MSAKLGENGIRSSMFSLICLSKHLDYVWLTVIRGHNSNLKKILI